MEIKQWRAYPDFEPPVGACVLIRTLRHSVYHYQVARFCRDQNGAGYFAHPQMGDRYARLYPNAWLMVPLDEPEIRRKR